jgi:two-component system, OmpR family, manganese sensing sensor histidine kinase
MFQETRKRLAIWYTSVTAVVLLIFATSVYFYVSNTLIERIDDTLKHIVEVVERSLVIEKNTVSEVKYRVNIEASFRNNSNNLEDDHIDIEWFNSMGELLWTTFNEPPKIPLSIGRTGKTVHLSSDHLARQVTKRIDFGRYVLGYLRITHPWFEFTKPIRQFMLDLVLALSLMIISVGTIGWLLSGIAIKPVKDSYQSLKQFTADASHELRNPIAMIQTNVQLALAYPEPQLQEKQLQVIERLTQRLGRLVNDLLFLTRSDSGMFKVHFQPVPLDALLIEVIEEQRIFAEQKGIILSLNIENNQDISADNEDQFTIQGEWDQLARLFTNLISNGIEYSQNETKNNQELIVELQLIKRDRNPKLQVKIKDQGMGIAEELLPHIFDRFYRVDSSRSHRNNDQQKGSGLGLAIAKAIAENHQGQITVESKINQGTTFTVILPINSN